MVVDHCTAAVVDENINMTSANRAMCEADGQSPGEYDTLNIDRCVFIDFIALLNARWLLG